jgi:hypothetical protein
MEMPIMLVVIVVAARWISRDGAAKPSRWLGTGIVALALMLLAEFAVVLPLRGLSIREYAARLDPVSGTVYYLLLGSLAVMPLLVGRGRPRTTPSAIERPSRRGAAEGPSPRWTPGDSP